MSTAFVRADRYVTLDIVRGIAALSVVFWHWQHFYFVPARRAILVPDIAAQPLYALFWPLYQYGHLAVDLFFCLSGFVFFYLYATAVRDGTIPARTFAVLRLSRLYPLHIATLLTVAALQAIYWSQHGVSFVYLNNDVLQFALQLFFVSNWPPNFYLTFNGPVWSVSIEAMLYIVFFILCRMKLTAPAFLAVLSIAGAVAAIKLEMVGRGFHSFFLGGLCWAIVQRRQGGSGYHWRYLASCVAAIELAAFAVMLLRARPVIDTVVVSVAFPALITALALSNHHLERYARPAGWIGNLSYSSYLLHFPMQLFLAVVAFGLGLSIDYASPLTLCAFMTALIVLSLGSYYGFERPVQRALRRRLLTGRVRELSSPTPVAS